MSEYRTGTVRLVNATSYVRADSSTTTFTSNVHRGDLFKKRGENIFYEVASVVNSTTLQLSSVYAGTSGTGQTFVVTRDFTPNLTLPEISVGDQDFADIYTRAIRRIDNYIPGSITTFLEDTSTPHAYVSATCFTASGNQTSIYVKDRFLKIRGNVAAASANKYSLVSATSTYNATTHLTTVRTDVTGLSATPTRFYYAAALSVLTDQIKDTHIDFGTGSNQVNASDIPIIDTKNIITATNVEKALWELKTDFLSNQMITASVDYNWVAVASLCTRASNDVFNASGNVVTTFLKLTNVKVCATSNASYYSYVSSLPVYNSTTNLTRIMLASQSVPATPVRWYSNTGNTASKFILKGIGKFADNYFNSEYYIEFTTGSLAREVQQVTDWTGATTTVVATAVFTATPKYRDSLRLLRKNTTQVVASDSSITVNHRTAGYYINVTDPLVLNSFTATTGVFHTSLKTNALTATSCTVPTLLTITASTGLKTSERIRVASVTASFAWDGTTLLRVVTTAATAYYVPLYVRS